MVVLHYTTLGNMIKVQETTLSCFGTFGVTCCCQPSSMLTSFASLMHLVVFEFVIHVHQYVLLARTR
jgi:hypothetical protein